MKINEGELTSRLIARFRKEGYSIHEAYAITLGRVSSLLAIAMDGDVAYVEKLINEIMAIEPKGE